ncbi:MAG TPA: hypothetical protein VKU02_24310 [Gemmataceae bacterium]|nr:hypothetical protein [Gemmataceae bacterium]
MPRSLLAFAVLATFSLPCRGDQTAPSSETVIRLTVQPMAAPKPALRYLLLPDLKEINPGNPAHGYLRCFAEQQNFFFDKEICERRNKLLTMPLKELPVQDLLDYGKFALHQADWAARLDKPDWQILLKLRTDGVNLLLPDLQQMRTLANALKVRFRAEVALGRFDDAIRTAKTLFAMSRHLGEHPTLISDLVAMAIAFVAIDPLQEMLEQPGCPNLYWALTNLPTPLVSLEKGLEGETVLIAGEFRDLDENTPMNEDQLRKLMAHVDLVREVNKNEQKPDASKRSTRAWLDEHLKDPGSISSARRRLVEAGFPEDRLLRFPAEQVLLLDEMRGFKELRDESAKLMPLPAWQVETLAGQIKAPNQDALFESLASAYLRVRRAQGRLEQRIALLRHVEALRLYAAEHDGKLPVNLSEITVPLPPDPFTGKPFHFRLDGVTAHLRGTPPAGLEKDAAWNIHYEVTIQK